MTMDEGHLNAPVFLADFELAFSELLDYMNFAEQSLTAYGGAQEDEFSRIVRNEQLDNEEYFSRLRDLGYRLEVSLPIRIRYSAVIALVTTIEWAVAFLRKHSNKKKSSPPGGVSEVVHATKELSIFCGLNLSNELRELERLVHVRNCIIHNAGLVDGYQFCREIQSDLVEMRGFGLSDQSLLGHCIQIERGEIQARIIDSKRWVSELMLACWKERRLQF